MKKPYLLILLITFFWHANAQNVKIELPDGHELAATLTIDDAKNPSALLLHQCNRTKEMWKPLVDELVKAGFNTITVDMRGYGQSANDAYNIDKQDYDYVTQHFRNDIDQINAYWRKQLPQSEYRVVVGASCGGGLAAKTAVTNEDIRSLVLFSPSLRPHWLAPEYRDRLSKQKMLPILGIASEGDTKALKYIEEVFDENQSSMSQNMVYKGRMHGEPLFAHDPKLAQYITDWILRVK